MLSVHFTASMFLLPQQQFNHQSDLQTLVAQKGQRKTLKYPQLLTVLAPLTKQQQ